jgi:hypothetical protein
VPNLDKTTPAYPIVRLDFTADPPTCINRGQVTVLDHPDPRQQAVEVVHQLARDLDRPVRAWATEADGQVRRLIVDTHGTLHRLDQPAPDDARRSSPELLSEIPYLSWV